MNLRVLLLLLFISLEFPILKEVPIEEPEKNSCALTLLLGVRLVENIGKHEVVLDGQGTGLEVMYMTHH